MGLTPPCSAGGRDRPPTQSSAARTRVPCSWGYCWRSYTAKESALPAEMIFPKTKSSIQMVSQLVWEGWFHAPVTSPTGAAPALRTLETTPYSHLHAQLSMPDGTQRIFFGNLPMLQDSYKGLMNSVFPHFVAIT